MATDPHRSITDFLLGRGLISAETIAQELRDRLIQRLSSRRLPDWELIDLARETLDEFEPLLARNLYDTEIASWVAGVQSVAARLNPKAVRSIESTQRFLESFSGKGSQPPRPPLKIFYPGDDEPVVRFPLIEKAAESLAKRNVMSPEQFAQLADDAKRQSFTVAGENSVETLQSIRDVLSETVSEGASLKVFRDKLAERIDTSRIGPGHLENVYRTNVQTAFHQGYDELASNSIVMDAFPYQEYLPIHDGRVRHEHLELGTLGLSGTGVYRSDDPFWDVFTPPWDYQCRCGINRLTIEAAARKGVKEAQEWRDSGQPPTQPEWRLSAIPFRPRAGWGTRPRIAA